MHASWLDVRVCRCYDIDSDNYLHDGNNYEEIKIRQKTLIKNT